MIGAPDDLPIPAGSLLLHIGAPGAAASGVRRAFRARGQDVSRQRVRWLVGPKTMAAARAVTDTPSPVGGRVPGRDAWRRLVRRVERNPASRMLISSDAFAAADEAAIRTIVEDLGPDRVHVAVTLEPIGDLLARLWQQAVLDGLGQPFEAWLEMKLEGGVDGARGLPSLRLDRLVARWAAAVDPARVTVIVAGPADGNDVSFAFEALLGLRPGTVAAPSDSAARDLTMPESEVLRAYNEACQRLGLRPGRDASAARHGVAGQLLRRIPREHEAGIALPEWARAHVATLAGDIAEGLADANAGIVGNLADLSASTPGAVDAAGGVSAETWAEIGAAAAVGVLISGALLPAPAGVEPDRVGPDAPPRRRWPPVRHKVEPIELAGTSTLGVARMLLGRGLGSLRARVGLARAQPAKAD